MYKRLNCDSCLQSLGPQMCLLPHDSGRLASVMSHQEEEEAGEFLLTCHNTVGCCEFISGANDAQWSTDEPIYSELCITSSLTGCDPSVYLAHHQMEATTTDYAEVSQFYTGGCCCEGLMMEMNGFLEPKEHNIAPCWAESPCVQYGAVRRNMVVGVEVVEEVAVEEELEVILEDVQADDLLDIEVLQHEHLYPTRKPECFDL